MRKIYGKLALFIFLLVLSVQVFSAGMSGDEIRQLITRTDQNSAPDQYEAYAIMKNYKPDRPVMQNKLHIYHKNDKMVAIFQEPASQKGQAFVRDGDDMWMYLPRSKKVTRIGAKEKSMGGEASNADILRVNLAEDYDGMYLGEETLNGTACYKLQLTAKKRTVAYDKIIYWIDKEKELPVKREYFVLSGKKLKTMYFSEYKILGGLERPSLVTIISEENKAYMTEMITLNLNPDVNLADYTFTPSYIKQGLLN